MTIRCSAVVTSTALLSIAAACSEADSFLLGVNALDIVFITQSEPQAAHMDALFTGNVIVDQAKCTRMIDADRATVIWPPGFTVIGEDGALVVRNGAGQDMGILGGNFRIGGGLVQQLNPQLHISYMDRALAQEFCPGSYWIVSDVHPVR